MDVLDTVDGIDNAITGICVVGALAGGAGLGALAIKVGVKQVSKAIVKQILKKEGKQVLKTTVKQAGKSNIGANPASKVAVKELQNSGKRIDTYNLKTAQDVQSQFGKYTHLRNTYGNMGKYYPW